MVYFTRKLQENTYILYFKARLKIFVSFLTNNECGFNVSLFGHRKVCESFLGPSVRENKILNFDCK